MGIDKKNHEGYFDKTAHDAINNIQCEDKAADKKAAYLPLVYICSPYAGDVETNVMNAKLYSRFAMDQGTLLVLETFQEDLQILKMNSGEMC